MTIMLAQSGDLTKRLRPWRMVFGSFVMLFWWVGASGTLPAGNAGEVEEVRTLYPSEWSVPYPVGMAYARADDYLFLLDHSHSGLASARQASDRQAVAPQARITIITPYEDFVATVPLPLMMDEPLNLAYDDVHQHLLYFDNQTAQLVRFRFDEAGRLRAMTYVDLAHLEIRYATSLAVDSHAKQLVLLDQGAQQLVRVELGDSFKLLTRVTLAKVDMDSVRGMAIHPLSHNIFIADAIREQLYEFTAAGWLVGHHDMSALDLVDVRAIAFAPSADLTDDPATIHLYIADSNVPESATAGDGKGANAYGRVIEIGLRPVSGIAQCRIN